MNLGQKSHIRKFAVIMFAVLSAPINHARPNAGMPGSAQDAGCISPD
ncbi:mCG147679 [Mus musculus]|nr:mCG147679 [Mus musculus]